jgi:SET domain-containing protein
MPTPATQKKGARRFAVRRSSIHNRGVFALARIPAGTRIVEYKGERISPAEAERRYDGKEEGDPSHTFLFAVDDDTVIDATFGGNSARWINHSCEPNCEVEEEDGRIFIHALRTLRPGEELLYDYSLFCDGESVTPEMKRQYECRCGSKHCRGTMLDIEYRPTKKKV